MTKITKVKNQYRINIPIEIIKLKEWNEDTEVLIFPFIQDSKMDLGKDTPIMIKEIRKMSNEKIIK